MSQHHARARRGGAHRGQARGVLATSSRLCRPVRLRTLGSLIAAAAVLAVTTAGAVSMEGADATSVSAAPWSPLTVEASGTDRVQTVSRSWRRQPLLSAPLDAVQPEQPVSRPLPVEQGRRLQAVAERRAAERTRVLRQLAARAERRGEKLRSRIWTLPTRDYRISGMFGEAGSLWSDGHSGLDLAAPYGTPLFAVAAGTVTEATYDGDYGYKTVITLEDGTEIWYGHQDDLEVSVGESVSSGDRIGSIGMTGNTTGPHLHLEVRTPAGTLLDPYAVLVKHGAKP